MVGLQREELVNFFAEFWEVDKTIVTDEFKLDDPKLKEFTSVRSYQFIAEIEARFKVQVENLNKLFVFKDLLDNIKPVNYKV